MGRLGIIIFLSLVIGQLSFGTVRYVSHSGSNTPPYLTWETAADSIMSAVNISSFGDTIYVANGVYEEQVVMIPGLSLIGAGMDSCVIDTRALVNSTGFVCVEVADSCLLKGFHILAYNNTDMARGISGGGDSSSLVTLNKVTNAKYGIFLDKTYFPIADVTVYKNTFENVHTGVELFNSNSLVRGNTIYTDLQWRGINIGAYDYFYTPHIDSNYIVAGQTGISMVFDTKATFSNNVIILKGNWYSDGIFGGNPDTTFIYNNLIIANAENASNGIANVIDPTINQNNTIIGKFGDAAIFTNNYNLILNNNVINGNKGIVVPSGHNPVIKYNNSWNNTANYAGFTPDSTNLSVDPMVVNTDTSQGDLDFHLQKYSPLIDAGDPSILDRDGSRSDIGLYGGPFGEVYTYNDLAPRPPHNVTAVIEQGLVKLTWNRNTEADFSHYRIYRDTVSNFIYDTTKIIGETTDTVYYDNLPPVNEEKNYYYLITAFDNQGNQSYPSEEVVVQVTGLTEHPPIGSDGFRLLSNYPNPFNPSTIIPYRLKEGGYVKLYIYDIKGELVETLVNQWQNKGYYEVVFRPTADQRQRAKAAEYPTGPTLSDMASGVYLYMIMVSSERNIPVFTDMGKMILLK